MSDFERIVKVKFGNNNVTSVNRIKLFLSALILNEGFIVTFWFRIASYLHSKRNIFAKITYLPVRIIYLHCQRITGIQLPVGTKVGNGLMFNHYSCIVIAGSATIGDNCTVFQGVTIGRTWDDTPPPIIGNNCVICAGAKVIGGVTIGDRAVIGANAVVTKDVPNDAVSVGVPAKIVSNDSSKVFNDYFKVWLAR